MSDTEQTSMPSLNEIISDMRELNDTYNKDFKELYGKLKTVYKNLKQEIKTSNRELKKASKNKRKKSKPNKSGINEPRDIPAILKKFIGNQILETYNDYKNDKKLSRSKVFSAFHKKMNQEGCKDGQKLVINAKVAKALKLKKGAEYMLREHQKLLSSFYTPQPKKTKSKKVKQVVKEESDSVDNEVVKEESDSDDSSDDNEVVNL
jgi:hypothetical protein